MRGWEGQGGARLGMGRGAGGVRGGARRWHGLTRADTAAHRTCPAPSSTSWSSPRRGRRDVGPARDCASCPACTNGAERHNFRYSLGEGRG